MLKIIDNYVSENNYEKAILECEKNNLSNLKFFLEIFNPRKKSIKVK